MVIIVIEVGFIYDLVVSWVIIDLYDVVVVFNLVVRLFYVVLVVIIGFVFVLVYMCVELILGGKVLKFMGYFVFVELFG